MAGEAYRAYCSAYTKHTARSVWRVLCSTEQAPLLTAPKPYEPSHSPCGGVEALLHGTSSRIER